MEANTTINKVEDIIVKCGGVTKVSTQLALSVHTVCDWIANGGIPAKHWKSLVEDFNVDVDDLLSLQPRGE